MRTWTLALIVSTGVAVAVAVTVLVAVALCVGLAVFVAVTVTVGVNVSVGVAVGVFVAVAVAVGDAVEVAVAVDVETGVTDAGGPIVAAGDGVFVGIKSVAVGTTATKSLVGSNVSAAGVAVQEIVPTITKSSKSNKVFFIIG